MTTSEILRDSKELIADLASFSQMSFARREDGSICDPESDDAVSWCAAGAILHVTGEHWYADGVVRGLRALARVIDPAVIYRDMEGVIGVIADVNDRSGLKDRRPDLAFKKVHRIYDEAIKLVEEAA